MQILKPAQGQKYDLPGYTPFFIALNKRHYDVACYLRSIGADPYVQDENGYNLSNNFHEVTYFLRLEDMQGPNSRREKNNTLLMDAARFGFTFIVRRLLADNRLDINAVNNDGNTALHLAARGGHAADCLFTSQ